jgi:hypothetical protein
MSISFAYASDEAYDEFGKAWAADLKIWRVAIDNIDSGELNSRDDLKQARQEADKSARSFIATARKDLQNLQR